MRKSQALKELEKEKQRIIEKIKDDIRKEIKK